MRTVPRRWRLSVVGLLVVILMAVAGLFGGDPQLGDERVDPASLLGAPADPVGSTQPAVESEPPQTSPLAGGWERLDLPGPGPLWAVAAGAGGWAAVTGTERPAVWVSPNAATWLYRPLPVETPAEALSLAVSAGGLAIVTTSSVDGRPESTAWLSDDGARTWRAVPFPTPAVVDGVEATSAGWIAFGRVGSAPVTDAATSRGDDPRPAVWRLGSDGVEALEFLVDPGPDGEVGSVIDRDGTVVALGRVFTGPRGWNLRDGILSPFIPVTPVDAVSYGFGRAARIGGDRVVAVLRAGPSSRLVASGDLVDWTEVETTGGGIVSRLEEAGEYVIGLGESVGPPFLLASHDGFVWELVSASSREGGLAGATAFTAAAGGDGVVVVGGFRGDDPALWRWGGVRDLGWVVQGPPAVEGRWLRVAQAERVRPSDSTHPVSAVVTGIGALIADERRVMWIPDLADPEVLIPARLDRSVRLVTVRGEVYGLEYPGRALIHRYTGGATWASTVLWDGFLAGITDLDGVLTAFGVLEDGTMVRSTSSGDPDEWSEPEPLPPPGGWEPFSFDGAVVRLRGRQPQLSTDGEAFTDVAGEPRGFAQGLAALVEALPEGGSAVTVPAAAGESRVWEVPLGEIRSVYLAGDRLVVLGSGVVLAETAEGWEELPPLDLGHGVFGSVDALLAPAGDEIFAVGRADGNLTVWRLER